MYFKRDRNIIGFIRERELREEGYRVILEKVVFWIGGKGK